MSVPTRVRRRPNDGLPEQPTGTWAFTGLPAVTRSELIVVAKRSEYLDKKRGRDGTKYSKFHPRGYLSHHLAAISMAAVYTDAAHIADGVIGLQQRSLAVSGPTE